MTIIEHVSNADRILIIGPGEAKIELKKEIEKSKKLTDKIKEIQSADKMATKQIAAIMTAVKPNFRCKSTIKAYTALRRTGSSPAVDLLGLYF